MKSFDGFMGLFVRLKVDEAKASAFTLFINLNDSGSDITELFEELSKFFLGNLSVKVLDVNVSEVRPDLFQLRLALLY